MRRRPDGAPDDGYAEVMLPAAALVPPKRALPLRIFEAIMPAWPMALIWTLISANYLLHVLWRPASWNAAVLLGGHLLAALQIASFVQVTQTEPGTVTSSEDEPMPPRSYFVKRLGTAILGFDHHCWWLGTPIGWRNRKFFLLFVLWSSLLCLFAAALSAVDLYAMGILIPDSKGGRGMQLFAAASPMALMLFSVVLSELSRAQMMRALCLLLLLALDTVAGLLLGVFGIWHVKLILRNQTSVCVGTCAEAVYDVGAAANWRQVMGTRRELWALPVWRDDGPVGDGTSWPRTDGRADEGGRGPAT